MQDLTLIYRTDNIMIMCGEDFAWKNSTLNSAVIQILSYLVAKVINHKVTISTVSEYSDALFQGNYEFPVFHGDFIPYLTTESPYLKAWTGFYTTRPYLKDRIMETKKLVRAAEILQSLVNGESFTGYEDDVGTHHDAFPGTCYDFVFLDYIRRLDQDYVKCLDAIADAFFSLVEPSGHPTALMIPYKVMILFNPINQNVQRMISFVSNSKIIEIFDSEGTFLNTQSVPYNNSFEIYFKTAISSLGIKVLFVRQSALVSEYCFPSFNSTKRLIHNEKIGVEFKEGLVSTIYDGAEPHHFDTRIMGYNSSLGGAYTLYLNVIPM